MAQNLTASALTFAQDRLEALFPLNQSTPSRYPWINHQASAAAFLREHRANVSEVLDEMQKCIGYRVYWLKKGDDTVVHNGTPAGFSFNCTMPSGIGAQSSEKIYTNNFAIVSRVEVSDDLCGNVFRDPGSTKAEQQMTVVANRVAAGLKDIRDKLNTKVVNFFDTNKTAVNNDASLPSGITFGSSLFTVDEAVLSMQEPDTWTDLDAIATNNDMTDYFFLGGRNHFYNARVNADFRVSNDTERDHVRLLDGNGTRMYHDIKNIDSSLSGSNSFLVDPGSYVFWDFINKERTQTPMEVDDDTFEYYIEDPIMRFQGRPLRYAVRYQKVCDGHNSNQWSTKSLHRWEITLLGGLYVAPPSEDNHTGILKLKSA